MQITTGKLYIDHADQLGSGSEVASDAGASTNTEYQDMVLSPPKKSLNVEEETPLPFGDRQARDLNTEHTNTLKRLQEMEEKVMEQLSALGRQVGEE